MKGFNYSSNGRTLEVMLPMGLDQVFSNELRSLIRGKSSFERVVIALAIFSLQTKNECLMLRDLVRIVDLGWNETSLILANDIYQRKSEVLSLISLVCCELVEQNKLEIGSDLQQDYLNPDMPGLVYDLFAHRLISHVFELQLGSEHRLLGIDQDYKLDEAKAKSAGFDA